MSDTPTEGLGTEHWYTVARAIFLVIAPTPFLAALVALWYYAQPGRLPIAPEASFPLFAWMVVSVAGFLLWRVFRERTLELVRAAARGDVHAKRAKLQQMLNWAIISWAGAELVGLGGVLVLVLSGSMPLFLLSLGLAAVLFVIGRPRREWFPAEARTPGSSSRVGVRFDW